ncbi:tetratricopeptide repeat protein, partial [Myxococcota bacterium]|nr:tetratricopeptide repeat protein [Myxococcota bacterium]MBU1535136.1 tetratricopeptide repeat protein [Myxococcota bacterium]
MPDPSKNIEQLQKAYELKPYDTTIILDLLALLEETGDWPRVNELLKRLTELEENPAVRAKYFFSIGQVFENHLGEPLDAIENYDKCIDSDPTLMVAFLHMANLIRAQKKWRKLEREYSKMIKRLASRSNTSSKDLFQLWLDLGVLYHEKIRDDAKALEAYESALGYDSSDLNIRLRMAEIQKTWEGDKQRDALHIYEEILELDPFNRENMTQLFKLHWEKQDYDRAWCLSALIKSLNLKNKDADHFYDQHLPKGLTRLPRGSIDGLWRHLIVSRPEDYYLGQLFALMADIVPVLRGENERTLGILGETPQSPHIEGPTFTSMFYYVIDTYGFSAPPLYLLPEDDSALRISAMVVNHEVVKVVTAGHQLLRGLMEKDLAFIIGRDLIYLLPGYLLIKLLPSRSELVTLILGAIKLSNPRISFGDNERIVNKAANQIADLIPSAVINHLSDIIRDVSDHGTIPDIDGYIDRARLSSHRIGFLLSQNINTALELMKAEDYGPSGLTFEAAQRELIKFAATK